MDVTVLSPGGLVWYGLSWLSVLSNVFQIDDQVWLLIIAAPLEMEAPCSSKTSVSIHKTTASYFRGLDFFFVNICEELQSRN